MSENERGTRKPDPNTKNIVHIHTIRKYKYASIIMGKPSKSQEGKYVQTYVHLGKVLDNVFYPNERYKGLDKERRLKLKFPADMDTHLADEINLAE